MLAGRHTSVLSVTNRSELLRQGQGATTREAASLAAIQDDTRAVAAVNAVLFSKDVAVAKETGWRRDAKITVRGRGHGNPPRALVVRPLPLLPPSPFLRNRGISSLPSNQKDQGLKELLDSHGGGPGDSSAMNGIAYKHINDDADKAKMADGAGLQDATDVDKFGTGAGGAGSQDVEGAGDQDKAKNVAAVVVDGTSDVDKAKDVAGVVVEGDADKADDRAPGARRRRRTKPRDERLLQRILLYARNISGKLDDLCSRPRTGAADMDKIKVMMNQLRWSIPFTTGLGLFVGVVVTVVLAIKFGIPFVIDKFAQELGMVLQSIDAEDVKMVIDTFTNLILENVWAFLVGKIPYFGRSK
ncbi:uncharacterized protein [Oryza sativa Japonica Group]|uniref:Os07g0143900 protein n=4 Tax=Oryza TaxID=4527 RepID=A3BGI5_ORYSJ|nr:uncharacterized protein LOC4342388 [Oryza sativa Japonica Group]EAZ02752.1 hypothetical protein OsI_24872 [Oryza sativa Indica Group]KAB8104299.1 hypothetical protein EE612_037081 [Oryza sativa]EAZ38674.1 hypothetical protein OsJ_23068 [Oryza sativa Japonica Group]KAF2921409.1 hypothetical protein DAI22_07g031100 [Oryza sativa Japonica Group]BAC19958.1 unknown protein [Oryza sativa Japonica Group]|eukprot:NP_001058880.1 Os07g0143900 [Oryza sativa Japonica Group]